MCGIAGTFGFIPKDDCKERTLSIMASRGPDDSHHLDADNNVWMGAVRLAFQDLERGRQPFVCNDGSSIVTLNGEIYNYKELADHLSEKGWNLSSKCDTELIGYLYLEYGVAAFRMLRGMFAVAIYHKNTGQLLLASDFLAQKPLYYYQRSDGSFVYASHKDALVVLSQGDASEYTNEGINDVLLYKAELHINDNSRHVRRLAPGQIIRLNPHTYQNKSLTYYNFSSWLGHNKLSDDRERNIIDRIEDLLLSAIERRVDETKGQVAFLSGGVDSSLITMMLRRLYPRIRIDTFTLCYHDDTLTGKNLDRVLAKEVSRLGNTNHHEVFCNPIDMIHNIYEITDSFGGPFSAVPSMWFVTREMKKYAKYTLSGDGADELFGSYFTHRNAVITNVKSCQDALSALRKYMASFWPPGLLSEAYLANELGYFPEILDDLCITNDDDPIKIQLLTEALTLFPSTVLTYVDRLSMAHSLEARSPFLDSDLWDYVMMLPDRFRIRDGETKYALKKVAERYLPNQVIYRKKEGFVYPVLSYLRAHRDLVSSRICSIPEELIDGVFTKSIQVVVHELYTIIDEGNEFAFKAAQALHALYCIYIGLSRRSFSCV